VTSTARRLALVFLAFAALIGASVTSAHAADTHAPKGARLDWLPSDTWVMSSWLPYDEQRLYAVLHTSRDELRTWLVGIRTLGALARMHGLRGPRREIAERLVAPRLAQVPKAMRATLRRRALDTLTQAHLARHVLFHVFHTPAIPDHAASIFGVSPSTFRRLRNSGMSPQSIGARSGRTAAQVRSKLSSVLQAREQRGAAVGAMSPLQEANLRAEQSEDLTAYVSRAYRTSEQQIDFLCHPH